MLDLGSVRGVHVCSDTNRTHELGAPSIPDAVPCMYAYSPLVISRDSLSVAPTVSRQASCDVLPNHKCSTLHFRLYQTRHMKNKVYNDYSVVTYRLQCNSKWRRSLQ